jgi:hypothetical protein
MELQLVVVLLGVVGAPVALALAALRWGFDSRDGFRAVDRSA